MRRKKSAEMEIRMKAKVKEYSEQVETGAKVKLGTSDKIIRGFGYIFVTVYAVCCILPFLIIVGSSFSSETVIRTQGVQLFPKELFSGSLPDGNKERRHLEILSADN